MNFTDALINSIISTTEGLRLSFNNPSDQIRILTPLASYQPAPILSGNLGVIQAVMAAACRRAALSSLANACAAYNPTVYDEAVSIITLIRGLFNAEILYAADGLEDDIWANLTASRDAVIKDLKTRSTNLPHLTQYNYNTSLPNFVIAYQLYGDASRQDEVLSFNNSVSHPFFMPSNFVALSQ